MPADTELVNHAPDVLVVGGGVIGLTVAYELAGQGVAVRLLDKGRLGREASWAGAGMLPPGNPHFAAPEAALRAESHVRWDALTRELRETTGIDNGYTRCGGLHVLERDALDDLVSSWSNEGVSGRIIEADEVREHAQALATDVDVAAWLPEMGQVRNPRHVAALVSGCVARGVDLREGEPVLDFELDGDRVLAARTPSGRHSAGRFCVTGGAWSRSLLEPFGVELEVTPVRGQIVLLRTPSPLLRQVVEAGPRYLVPRPDGRLLVGATEERVGFDKRTTAAAVAELIEFATDLVPALGEAEVERTWAGLRPGSPDRRPFLDRVPDLDNLFVAAGHFREGLQTSPATAVLMREMILDQPCSFSPEPFRLSRRLATTPV